MSKGLSKEFAREPLRAVVIKDEGIFVAQCLELDIATSADCLVDLREVINFIAAVEVNKRLNNKNIAEIDPAPKYIFDCYEHGTDIIYKDKNGKVFGTAEFVARWTVPIRKLKVKIRVA